MRAVKEIKIDSKIFENISEIAKKEGTNEESIISYLRQLKTMRNVIY